MEENDIQKLDFWKNFVRKPALQAVYNGNRQEKV